MPAPAPLTLDDGWLRPGLHRQVPLLLLAALLALLAVAATAFDLRATAAMPGFWQGAGAWLKDLLAMVRPLGHGEVLVIIALAFGAAGRRRVAQEGLLGLILVAALVWFLKFLVGRERPNGDPYSFPSGDTATCALLIPLFWNFGGRWARVLTGAAVLLTAGVAGGRVVKEFHYLSDVASGATVGVLAGILAHAVVARFRLPIASRWYLAAAVVVAGATWIGVLLKVRGGDLNPLLPPFLAAALPVLVLLIALPRVRYLDRRPGIPGNSRTVLGLAVVAGLGLAALALGSTLWDRDETFYAETAQEMLESGRWLVPTFNGEPFLHKPPFIYWLMSGSVAVFGPTELAFRGWSCAAMVGILGLLAWLAARLLGPASGPRLVLLFATMPLMLVVGAAATTDAVLLLSISIAVLPWFLALAAPADDAGARQSSWGRALVMGLGMGLGMLTKAPLGIAVPGATLVLAWWLMRRAAARDPAVRPAPPLVRDLTIAVVLGMLIYLGWAIPTNLATNGQFWEIAIGKHIVGRAMAPMESHGGPLWKSWPYYLVVVLVACLPWTAYLPATVSAWLGGRLGDVRLRTVALAWFLPTFVLMTLVATKLPHYIVPALPGLALAVVATIAAAEGYQFHARDWRWLAFGRWGLAVLFVTVGAGLIVVPWFLPVEDPRPYDETLHALFQLRHAAVGAGLVFLVLPLAVWRVWLRRPGQAARMLAAGMAVVVLSATLFVLPSLEPFKSSDPVGRIIRARTAADVPVVTAGFDEPSLLLAIDRAPIPDLDATALRQWAGEAAPGVAVATEERLAESGVVPDAAGLTVLDRRRGYNYTRGKWLTLVTIGRHLPESR